MTQMCETYYKIGLTGGIGSGKSTAAKRFSVLGAQVYHADEVSRHALDPGTSCYDRVIREFGKSILNADNTIDRRKLGEIVFGNDEKRLALNAIIHPYVIDELFAQSDRDFAKHRNPIAIYEVPLLFESGMDEMMDRTIVVSCAEEARIQRVMERDNLSREHVLSRIRAQMPEEEKLLRADYILENNSSEEAFLRQVDALYLKLITEEFRA